MLDGVGDIHLRAVDAGLLERLRQQRAGRADRRMALDMFADARLLADQHYARARRSFAEDRLRGVLEGVASAAALNTFAQLIQIVSLGEIRSAADFPPRFPPVVGALRRDIGVR